MRLFSKPDPIRKLARQSQAGYLADIKEYTDQSYQLALKIIAKDHGIHPFAPWDIMYVRQHYRDRLNELGSFRFADVFKTLQTTVEKLGFPYKMLGVILVEKLPVKDPDAIFKRDHILLLNQHDRRKQQGGNTDLLTGWEIVKVELNLWDDGLETYRILFHEMGHALHFRHIRRDTYRTLRVEMPHYFTEGLAQVLDSYVFDPDWVHAHFQLDVHTAVEYQKIVGVLEILNLREKAATALWELWIHSVRNPDILQAWKTIAKAYLYPDVPEDEIRQPMGPMTRTVFYAMSSVIDVRALLLRDHVRTYLLKRTGGLYHDVALHLLPLYLPGGSQDPDDILRRVTGERLNIHHAFDYINSLFRF